MKIRSIAFCFSLALSISAQTSNPVQPIALKPCEVPGAQDGKTEKAFCAAHEVYENRSLRTGRKLSLKIVVFPATSRNKAADPVFYIAGGPGSSATEEAPYIAEELSNIRQRRDLVFVDQRGTGGSNPLNCDFFDPQIPQSYLGHWNPPADVRKCRELLEPKADLRHYVTTIAMDDLDEVRAGLGYDKINIRGTSYGTRAALTYLKFHEKNVRSVILHGVSPTNQFMPRDFAAHTQQALDGVLDECLADRDCGKAFPNIRVEMLSVLERLKNASVEVEIAPDGKKFKVKLSCDLAGEAIRYMLYQSGSASRVPLVIHQAAKGNFAPLAEAALFYRQVIVATGANGLYLSITCAEDLQWVKSDENETAAEKTFLGNYRLRQQKEACTLWPTSPLIANYAQPTRSDVPVLITTGKWDPVTPPIYGDFASSQLPNSVHIVVPSGGHGLNGLEGLECLKDITADFVEAASTKNLKLQCVSSIRRKGFVTK